VAPLSAVLQCLPDDRCESPSEGRLLAPAGLRRARISR
jgi:hypothetical protein